MMAWLRQHREAFARAFGKLRAQRGASLLNALVIGVALSLPAGGYALLANLQRRRRSASRSSRRCRCSCGRRRERADARAAPAQPTRASRRCASCPRDEALRELRQAEGLAEVIGGARAQSAARRLRRARARAPAPQRSRRSPPTCAPCPAWRTCRSIRPGRSAWTRSRASAGSALAALAALLAVGLVAVTFNTIRLQILTQREEIEVSQLIGATDAFIRRPFFYLGLLQGLAGGALGAGRSSGRASRR